MKIKLVWLILFTPIIILALVKKEGKQYAPPDAFSEDSNYAYYGSASEWGRQMFWNKQSKRRGQLKMLTIIDGKPQEAITMCRKDLLEDPNDTESLFMLTIAWLELDKMDSALESMNQALAAGLPFQRFLAGPRQLLKPLTDNKDFKEAARSHQVELIHGPMLGCMTDSSVRFWLRTFKEVPVVIRLFTDDAKSWNMRSKTVFTSAEKDYTTLIELEGLEANKIYSYDVEIEGSSSLEAPYPSFKTFPLKSQASRLKVAFGGGAGYTPEHERMWDTIVSREPDAFLFLGDNVYIDLPEMPGAFHDYTYYRRQSRPEYRRLVQSIPVFAIWDDHDSAINDVWLGPYIDKPPWKVPMLNVFKNNWNNPGYGTNSQPGCWYKFTLADVDFFMLDCRFYRTNPLLDNTTMLGPVQKEWLLQELKRSNAKIKVLVSSVPWAENTKPGSLDTWDGYKQEREEIFSYIEKHGITGILLLSADRHRSDVWKIARKNSTNFYEFESSKLTNMHTHKKMPGAVFSYNEKCSFGLLSIDTMKEDPEVNYRIISIDNESVYSLTLTKKRNSIYWIEAE